MLRVGEDMPFVERWHDIREDRPEAPQGTPKVTGQAECAKRPNQVFGGREILIDDLENPLHHSPLLLSSLTQQQEACVVVVIWECR